MRVNHGFLGWGVFLVVAGAIPLAVRAGVITVEQIGNVASLWPLILIGVGIGILLSRTRLAFLGGLVVAATFGVIVGGVLAGGAVGLGACGAGGRDVTAFQRSDGTFSGSPAAVDLELSCGDLTLSVEAGNGWHVEGDTHDGTGPDVDADGQSLRVSSREGSGWFEGLNDRDTWRVTLPEDVDLDISADLNAGSATLDLGQAAIDGFDLTLNAGSIVLDMEGVSEIDEFGVELNAGSLEVTLPNATFQGSIEANAGSVSLCAPPGAALRLTTGDSFAAGYDYDGQGLDKNGSTWETPGFDSAEVRIELDTQANAGSFSLNPEDGCGG
jgi:hypothetical protein